ncbi:uncharacterized protein LOC119652015 [Hermetia illucens]|uniref:uncharacterized protein LOC119652015 n=1 Tax=Hermetia illucens TaxID=343691 RepID=UPI0018CC0DBA|nr:uncharacterized protein LOC119652015 [Hermetia illucens]
MECNPYFISNCTARIFTLKGINVTDIDIYLRKELGDIIVHVTCFKQISNVYRIFAINVTWNLCDFFAKQGINFYQTVLMTWVAKWSNVNHACPYSGHVWGRNFSVKEDLPLFLPKGNYRLDIHVYEQNLTNKVGNLSALAEVI